MARLAHHLKTAFSFTLLCLVLSGCQLFTEGNKRLHQYCPGLNIHINGISWSINNGHSAFILEYNSFFQKRVNAFFSDKKHGFAGDNPGKYAGITYQDDPIIASGDSIVSKTINTAKKTATVIYDVTAGKIVILERGNE